MLVWILVLASNNHDFGVSYLINIIFIFETVKFPIVYLPNTIEATHAGALREQLKFCMMNGFINNWSYAEREDWLGP